AQAPTPLTAHAGPRPPSLAPHHNPDPPLRRRPARRRWGCARPLDPLELDAMAPDPLARREEECAAVRPAAAATDRGGGSQMRRRREGAHFSIASIIRSIL